MEEAKKDIETSEDIDILEVQNNNNQELISRMQKEIEEMKEKYLRLYAEFENYKKKIQKDKEELIKYSNEALIYELLPIVDSIEMAIKHSLEAQTEGVNALRQGVENTLREIFRTLEKFGVQPIEAKDKPFDPNLHHAMSQIQREDLEENTVVEEFRKGYMLKDKVIRPSLVVVSKKNE
ncbi:MAG: nucleotide exchange factor GrpE [Thermodesulfovibrionales bacterium]